MWPRDESVILLYGYNPLKASQYLTKFGGNRDCGSDDVIVLVFHVISQDHLIKESYDFIVKSLSRLNHHPTKFSGHKLYCSGDIMVLVYPMILQDHMIKGSCVENNWWKLFLKSLQVCQEIVMRRKRRRTKTWGRN